MFYDFAIILYFLNGICNQRIFQCHRVIKCLFRFLALLGFSKQLQIAFIMHSESTMRYIVLGS